MSFGMNVFHEEKKIPQKKQKIKISLNKKLINSGFPFSKRLWNMLSVIDCHTLEDLTKVPLGKRF